MSSVEYLRGFVNERLTAAAEEIFGVFKKTIVEYEEEIDRQRRLLEVVWKPEVKIHRIELPHQHVCQEEEVLCDQERSSILDQEEPEPPQIKEEEEELCSSQEGEQLVVKQETDTFMLTPVDEENDLSEDQTLDLNPDETLEESGVNMSVINSVVSEANRDQQLLSNNSHVAESQDQKGGDHEDSESTGDEEGKLNKTKQSKRKRHSDNVYGSTKSKTHRSPHAGKKSFKCDICGKEFAFKSLFQRHMRSHTGEKPYSCSSCGKTLSHQSSLSSHLKIHTGERPHVCNTCGRAFRQRSQLTSHTRAVHRGERPHLCKTCGKGFSHSSSLLAHVRIHTGEKPYSCDTCGRAFRLHHHLQLHNRRAHTGEKPYLCKICGTRYFEMSALSKHRRSHVVDG